MSEPHIEVKHPSEVYFQDVAHVHHISGTALDMPAFIAIGQVYDRWSGRKIESYADQVKAYTVWLDAQVAAQQTDIINQLEKIYGLAQGAGVIITTICSPSPYITHAHVVKDLIMRLAADD